MAYESFKEFAAKQDELEQMIKDTQSDMELLDVERAVTRLGELRAKVASDTFKIMVMGDFKTGKSTFINALLGEEILPAFATPTTAIINEIKYGEEPKAVLHYLNPQPAELYDGVPEPALAYIKTHEGEEIPPATIPVDEIEDYVVIPMGMDPRDVSKQSPFAKVELFWPLDILKDGVEIVDSPGLKESPVRTQVTMNYLSNADAVIFAISALAAGAKDNIDFIERTLPQYGITEQSLFCVVNRFNQVRNDRERAKVKAFVDDLMKPYTSHLYYINALAGLEGRERGDEALLEESKIPVVEHELARYLANDRGKVKLATPAREAVRCIRRDILEDVIPQRRRALALGLDELKERYAAAKPEIDKLDQQRQLIVAKAEALINGMEPDVRRYAISYFNELPTQVRAWVDEYTPQTEVSPNPLHLKRDVNALATELNDYLMQKLDEETRAWMAGPFAKLVEDKALSLQDSLEERLDDFYVSLDEVKLGVTGGNPEETPGIPTWQRVAAGVAGLYAGGVGLAIIGSSEGFSKEYVKNAGLLAGGSFVLAFLGLFNPVTIVLLIGGSTLFSLNNSRDSAVNSTKKSAVDQYCKTLAEKGDELVDSAVKGAMDNLSKIKDAISQSISGEIDQMQTELEGVIAEMEKGKENVDHQRAQLDEYEKDLRTKADTLDTFIFELAKQN